MLLKLYNLSKAPVGILKNAKNPKVESQLSNGDKQLSFLWHQTNDIAIPHEYYIRTDTDEFVVKENSKDSNGYRSIVAKLNLEEIEGAPLKFFEAKERTAKQCADAALAGTGWSCVSEVGDKVRSFSMTNTNAYHVLEKVCAAFTSEVRYDTINKTVYLLEKVGEDKGAYFVAGLNLIELKDKADSYDFCTRIIPIGNEGLGIASVNDGKEYIENHQYSPKNLTIIWEDTNYEDPQALKDDATYKLDELSKPKKSYSAKIRDLSKRNTKYSILSYSVGDTVTLIENETNIREKQRITKTVEYLDNPEQNTCELSNTVLSFEDMQKQLFDAAESINQVTDGNIVIGGKVDGLKAIQISGLEAYIASSESVGELTANYLYVSGELGAVKASIGQIETTYLKATDADIKYATIAKADILEANINNLTGDFANFEVIVTNDFTAANGRIDNLVGDLANYKEIVADDFTAVNGTITTLSGDLATYKTVVADQIAAVAGDITTLTGDLADYKIVVADDFKAVTGRIETLEAGKITVEYLNAHYADINLANIAAGAIKTAMIETGAIGTAQIADGSITDAKIVGLTANKITAGRLDAAEIEVVNLNAANITVGTINGQQIAAGAIDFDRLGVDVATAIDTAGEDAKKAQTTADGKNSIFYQSEEPETKGRKVNDIWFDTDNDNKMYFFDGSGWVEKQFGKEAIGNESITEEKIAQGSVQTKHIGQGVITEEQLKSGSITKDKIALGAVTASRLNLSAHILS